MDLEFYTVAQASRVLACEPDELEHFIELGKIPVFLYAKKDKFVITNGGRTGLALVTYTGLFRPKKEHIEDLCAYDEFAAEDEVVLFADGIIDWADLPPIDIDIYLQEAGLPITSWKATRQQDIEQKREYIALLYNHPHPIGDYLQSEHKKRRDEELAVSGHTDMPQHSYSGFWIYSASDIRISHADLMAFKANTQSKPSQANPSNSPSATIKLDRQRHNQLHELILRVLFAAPKMPARDVWKELKKDISRVQKKFDHDEILLEVSDEKIEWVSRYGHEQPHLWKSFPGTVSRLRKAVNPKVT